MHDKVEAPSILAFIVKTGKLMTFFQNELPRRLKKLAYVWSMAEKTDTLAYFAPPLLPNLK